MSMGTSGAHKRNQQTTKCKETTDENPVTSNEFNCVFWTKSIKSLHASLSTRVSLYVRFPNNDGTELFPIFQWTFRGVFLIRANSARSLAFLIPNTSSPAGNSQTSRVPISLSCAVCCSSALLAKPWNK
jgi:hypothetical protein